MLQIAKIKAREFTLQSLFKYGYRNKEDVSNLPAETLVIGSQNVLTNAAELVGIRQGYTLDGPAGNQNNYGIDSAYDFLAQSGIVRNLRKWGSNLEVRYQNPVTSAVSWINVLSLLNPNKVCNFTSFFDQNTELKEFCLFVNGGNSIYEWTGAVGSALSFSTATGIIAAINNIPNNGNTTSGGIGYVVGDVLTVSGGDGLATLQVNSIAQGGVATYSVGAAGNGYNVNDTITLTGAGGAYKAQFKVATLTGGAGSGVATLTLLAVGVGYFPTNGITTGTIGGGSGCTINVLTTGNTISNWSLLTNGSTYSTGNNVTTTGGTGSGATLEIDTVGNNSITLRGSLSCSQLGFYNNSNNSGKFQFTINGTSYTYTASNGNGGQTFVGISPTPSGISNGDAVVQNVQSYVIGATNSLPKAYIIDLISTLANQVWYGSFTSNTIYVSKTNDYTNVAFSTPARLPAEGALITLDAQPIGFFPQDNQMYCTAGRNEWWVSLFNEQTVTVSTVATPTETLSMQRVKTAFNQAAQSQGLIGSYKNSIIFVSNEPIVNSFGLVQNINIEPQMVNISDPIKYDMDAYDFTGGQILYDNYFIYVLIPKNNVVRMYNVVKKYWEAPQIIPIQRLYHVNAVTGSILYGHSSLTNESYKLFTGYNDNGNPINAAVAFPYVCQEGGNAQQKKNFNKVYTEGYIAPNTSIMLTINYDFGGFSGTYTTLIKGNDKAITFNKITDGSLGQQPLGSQPIGTILNLPSSSTAPKFRVINTMPRVPMYEYQIVYSSDDIDQNWSILRFGPAVGSATELPVEITE